MAIGKPEVAVAGEPKQSSRATEDKNPWLTMRFSLWLLTGLLLLGFAGHITISSQALSTTQSIQMQIDNAPISGTVYVSPGTYSGTLVVNKPIHLIGASRDNTIIDGGGLSPVILVNRSDVQITGFTVRNALSYGQGILLKNAEHVNVTSNNISAVGDGDGVSLDGSNNNTIAGNTFSNNLNAVNATDSNYNLVARNSGTDNVVGVQLLNAGHNVVANNTWRGGESGFFLEMADQNILVRNAAIKGSEIGIHLVDSKNNTVIENSVEFNRFGINIQNSQNNTFYHNNILSSGLFQVNFVSTSDKAVTTWDNGTAGNYWDDYKGSDTDMDGIGDTNLPADGVDLKPLMHSYVPILLAVKVSLNTASGPEPLTVNLSAHVLGGRPPYSYSWNLGDGTVSTFRNVTHVYNNLGTFVVKLQVSDLVGSTDQDTSSVNVGPSSAGAANLPWSMVGIVGAVVVVGAVVGLFFLRRRSNRKSLG